MKKIKINIHIITFGCSLNYSDSEVMSGILKKHGFELVHGIEKADVIIVNSCTVKDTTEKNFWNLLKKLKQSDKKVIIAGCIAQTEPSNSNKLDKYSLIGTTQINNIAEVVEETLIGNIIKCLERSKTNPRLNLPKIRKNPVVEIIPISQGCLGTCSYCKTKAARFDLVSYDKDAIVCQAKEAIKDGVKEIWLTSQDTAVYGFDIKDSLTLIGLLNDLIQLKGEFKIRIGMGNPNHLAKIIDELIPIMKSDKVFKFLHIPVQSGNDDVLKNMNRKYNVSDFKNLIQKIRKEIPEFTISTDIIVGFPGETESQFLDSVNIIKEIKPAVLNISRYSPRPNTIAASLSQLHSRDIKERSRLMTHVFYDIAINQHKQWLGWEGEIIIDEFGKEGTYTMIGRNYAYKPVIVKISELRKARLKHSLGIAVKVKITKTTRYDLRGEIIY
ncbi:MAG: tRNA (N(6)-L-threonylcarbamoyladenosine(37)-C(2))-methylthiotransferase [Candidatus Woesearchaeota archaeon]